jgi:hypothetical protein
MLNQYGGYAPNLTLDVTVGGVSQVLFGNQGGPNFEQGNYPQVSLKPHIFHNDMKPLEADTA